jgi:hypothetical protein
MIEFSYHNGNLRYFDSVDDVNLNPPVKSDNDGYIITVVFNDNSCLCLVLYSWEVHIKVSDINMQNRPAVKVIPKSPIEITDDTAFTLEAFKKWLQERKNANIFVNCSTTKGAFDITNHVLGYVFLTSNIHPKTKTKNLKDDEIEKLYTNLNNLVDDYRQGKRIYKFIDIYGVERKPMNDVVRMDSGMSGKPCPICGAPIEGVPCGPTKMYFCPECQTQK